MNLQMTLKRRLTILAVVTTGGSAVLVSGLRAIVLFEFSTSPDFTWSIGKMAIISNIEMQVAILAANMPSLKAFYTCWRMQKLGRGQGVDLAYHQSRHLNPGRPEDIELSRKLKSSFPSVSMRNRPRDTTAASIAASEERLYEGLEPVIDTAACSSKTSSAYYSDK
ncbi:hypothetical protein JX266_009432 [Neoarthrinium moseri]|nr:uncharacterized protein JN550_010473 [Neoarthrinium moseri]KAI1844338.1 hypothetical protein JX266_009432 [Neoarthrinium moseri]KAI1862170.1 hypothetical protein JN550_010473 [Neoarthrinium moseri]